ncbi:hypothetical protein, variant 1 [Aphanomyces invadans]|uniref:Cyclin N-terminal domain-containing protein n=1 Tax=Aphanomyces invadans TaxID=157072 RepID=A0A024THT6_9STRA|nr:hypothetical protein, variant 1 [Aphanomyces invadans]ETV93725.1 hypothetical protein, variant 1 [Aphanomyces invadans]|eukprot:XP_008877766.1 hypothetical protein, variant 1 [Aphanomyces invadans]
MVDAAAVVGDDTSLSQTATSPNASQKSPLTLPTHRQVHDTYKVITPVNSPKRAPASTDPVSPHSSAVVQKRPNLHLNLSIIKSAPSRPLVPSATGRVKKVTRDIAALDFLQNIPMSSEYYSSTNDASYLNSPVPHDSNEPGGVVMSDNEDDHALAGRRLPGPDCQVVRMPPLIRYRMTTKYPPASATVRLWEGNMNEQGLLNGRIFLSSGKGYPVTVTSVIKYNGNQTKVRHPVSYRDSVVTPYDWRGKSYFQLLHSTWSSCDMDRDAQDKHPVPLQYQPNFLDNPEYRQGRHKDVIRGDRKLGPMVSSIMRFVKPNDLKEELNKQFREAHPWLHDSDLSLSKIRNLKQEALLMGQRIHLDISTVALACVYFEKLVLENYVTKTNRKLYMSACLILAVKFNEPRGTDDLLVVVKKLLVEIDQVHSIPSRDVLAVEFRVYAELSFALHVPLTEIQPHFARLLKCMESNPRKYLGEDIFSFYSKLVHDEVVAPLHRTDDDDLDDDDDCTDGEHLLSDAEELEDEPTETGRTSLFPWNQVSFTQWWKDRT